MKRNVLIVIIFAVAAAILLGGCYWCCPVCPSIPEEQFEPQILEEIWYCTIEVPGMPKIPGMIDYMRDIAPCANYRWPAKEWYQLTSLTDTQKVLDNIGSTVGLISAFHSQPGCDGLPFGYVKYSNGVEDYVTAVVGSSGIEFYKVLGPSGNLVKMYPNCWIEEIVLY